MSRPTLPAMAMTLSSVSFPREPMTAPWNSRYRPCFLEAIATRAANRETRTEDGKLLPDDAQLPVGFQQVPHGLQRLFAIAALVVEELDEGDIALRVARDRRHRVGPQRLVVVAERARTRSCFRDSPLGPQNLDGFFDDLGMFEQVFLDDLADRLPVEARVAGDSARLSGMNAAAAAIASSGSNILTVMNGPPCCPAFSK